MWRSMLLFFSSFGDKIDTDYYACQQHKSYYKHPHHGTNNRSEIFSRGREFVIEFDHSPSQSYDHDEDNTSDQYPIPKVTTRLLYVVHNLVYENKEMTTCRLKNEECKSRHQFILHFFLENEFVIDMLKMF